MSEVNDNGKKIVEELGRIRYVDPSNVFGTGGAYTSNGNIPLTPEYEDLCIAFNLIIERYNRLNPKARKVYALHFTETNQSKDGDGNPISDKNKSSILDGALRDSNGNRYLTTFYTDISNKDVADRDIVEGLGVENIQVSFDSYYMPTAVIKFVDVRGSALFGRMETLHKDGTPTVDSLFGSFFSVPYPKFSLQMKGFYGKDVTYQLTVSKFTANFNATTGNVEATVSFVGYTWSLLTDIPFNYLIAAPYCNYVGREYWNTHMNDQAWRMENSAKTGLTRETPITLFELFERVRNCMKEAVAQSDATGILDEHIESQSHTLNEMGNKLEDISVLVNGRETISMSDTDIRVINAIKDKYKQFKRLVEEFNTNNVVNPIEKDIVPDEIIESLETKNGVEGHLLCPKTQRYCKYLYEKKIPLKTNGVCVYSKNLGKKSEDCLFKDKLGDVDTRDKATTIDVNLNEKDFAKYNIECQTYKVNSIDDLKTAVNIRKNGLSKQKEELNAQAQKEQIDTVMRTIEIDPNIQNIFKILMCHLETFCHIMYAANTEIVDQKRTFSDLGIKEEHTDLPKNCGLATVPAWTAIFNKQQSDVNNKDEIAYSNAYEWVGNLSHNWVEEKVVWSFYRAVQKTQSPNDIYLTVDSLSDNMSYPFIPSDLTSPENIYRSIVNSGTYNDFCGNLGIRMAQILGIYNVGLNNNYVKKIAELDAYSLYKCCTDPEDLSRLFIDRLNKGDIVENITNILLAKTNEPANFEKEKTLNGRQPMFVKGGGKYDYVYMQTKVDNKVVDCIVPSSLSNFGGSYFENDISKELVTEGNSKYVGSYRGNFDTTPNKAIARNWMYKNYSGWNNTYSQIVKQYDICYNKNQFDIIDDGGRINMLIDMRDKLSEGNFNVNGYMVEDNYKEITDLYWKVGFDNDENTPYFVGVRYDKTNVSDVSEILKYKVNTDLDANGTKNARNALHVPMKWKDYKTAIINDEEVSVDDLYINRLDLKYISGDNQVGCFPLVRSFIFRIQEHREIQMFMILNSFYRNQKFGFINHAGFSLTRKLYVLLAGALLWMNKDQNYKKFVYVRSTEEKTKHVDQDKKYLKVYRKYLKEEDNKTVFCCYKDGFAIDTSSSGDTKNYINKEKLVSPKDFGLDYLNDDVKEHLIDYFVSYCKSDFCNKFFEAIDEYDPIVPGKPNNLWDYYFKNTEQTAREDRYMYLSQSNGDLQRMLRDVYLSTVIVTKCRNAIEKEITIPENNFKCYIKSFTDTLLKIYEEKTKSAITYEEVEESDEDKSDVEELIPIYIYLKNVWEKWLLPFQGVSGETGEEHYDVKYFFDNFVFMDSYYNRIGTKLKINLEKLLTYYEGRTEDCTLFSIIGDITKGHRCMFVGMPDFVDLGFGIEDKQAEAQDKMEKLFKPVPFNKMGTPRMDNHFVVIYTYPPASRISDDETYNDDGFDIVKDGVKTSIIDELFSTSSKDGDVGLDKFGYEIPAFAVAFARQNNHIFKNFNISMDNPIMTEQAIIALTGVTQLASGNDRRVSFYGQDVYNIYSDYSYSIEVEMMGNAQIQPLMYFQLMNIPMWSGTYMIYNVRHTMTPGNMVTNIKAMKMSKHPVPIISSYYNYIERGYGEGISNTYGGVYGVNESFDFMNEIPRKAETLPNFGTAQDGNVNDWLYKNHSNSNCLKVGKKVRTLFNRIYEEIMSIPGNKIDDTGKCKWNIYATSGLRTGSKTSDHAKGDTLDIQVKVDGKVKSSGTKMDEPYYFMVLAILRARHMGEFDRVMIEYPNIESYQLSCNKGNNSLHCLHLSCTMNPDGYECGPFINLYCDGWKFMVSHIPEKFGTAEKYMRYLHPSLGAMIRRDYNALTLAEFKKIWKGIIPFSLISDDKLKAYFSDSVGDFKSDKVLERAVELYNMTTKVISQDPNKYGSANKNFVLALVANACRESGCGINQVQKQGTARGIWQWDLQQPYVLNYAQQHYNVGGIADMSQCPTETQIKIALDQTLRNLTLYKEGYKLDGTLYGKSSDKAVRGTLNGIDRVSAETISDKIINEWLRPKEANRANDIKTSRDYLSKLVEKLNK